MRLHPAFLAICLGVACLPAQKPDEAVALAAYRQRTKEARTAADPREWLRVGDWIERQAVSDRTRKEWLTYIRHQYGVAAHKRLDDHDVDGWLRLADEMERLLASDSVSRQYLTQALKKNPGDERLVAALGRLQYGKAAAAGVSFAARKAEAERSPSAAAFADLATWCRSQIPHDPSAQHWVDYCVARELYLSGRGGGPTDPIRRALDEAAAKSATAREPREPQTPVGEHLPKREWKGLAPGESRKRAAYRIESGGEIGYADTPPGTPGCDAVWERGSRTSTTTWSDTQVMFEEHTVWWRLKWDAETRAWVAHTRAERRTARQEQILWARGRLQRTEQELAQYRSKAERGPGDVDTARQAAEKIARQGGDVKRFQQALRSIVDSAGAARYASGREEDTRRSIEAWQRKIAELETTEVR